MSNSRATRFDDSRRRLQTPVTFTPGIVRKPGRWRDRATAPAPMIPILSVLLAISVRPPPRAPARPPKAPILDPRPRRVQAPRRDAAVEVLRKWGFARGGRTGTVCG